MPSSRRVWQAAAMKFIATARTVPDAAAGQASAGRHMRIITRSTRAELQPSASAST